MRFIVEGNGAYTCVDGEKVSMAPGDLVLTPPMVWHDHGNEGNEPVMWLDGLDIPLMLALQCMFFEEFDGETQRSDDAGAAERKTLRALPLSCRRTRRRAGRIHPCGAIAGPTPARRLRLFATAARPIRWMVTCSAMRIPPPAAKCCRRSAAGCNCCPPAIAPRAHRHTASTVYHVAEGRGYSILGGKRFDWTKGDTFAVPIWCPHQHAALERRRGAVLVHR